MLKPSLIGAAIFLTTVTCLAVAESEPGKNGTADAELIDVIQHSFVPGTFDAATMSDESRVYFIADGKSAFLNKAKVVESMKEAKSSHALIKIDKFDVTSSHFGGGVTAISYLIDVHETAGNNDTTTEYICSDIWTKISGKYVLLFGTAEKKSL